MGKFAKPSEAPRGQSDPGKIIIRVEGELAGPIDLELNNDGTRSLVVVPLESVTIERANGDVEEVAKRDQRLPYSQAFEFDENRNRIPHVKDEDGEFLPPERQSPWYDVVRPALKGVGLDPDAPETIEEAIGRSVVFERTEVSRVWCERDERGSNPQTENEFLLDDDGERVRTDSNAVVYVATDGSHIFWDKTAGDNGSFVSLDSGEVTDLKPNQVQKQYVGLLPTSVD
jgi:hypothetical protein